MPINVSEAVGNTVKTRLPDFLVIGAQRSGTTSLYNYLIQHPQVSPARRKEVHFFSNNYSKGADWYRAQLNHCRPPVSSASGIPRRLIRSLYQFTGGYVTGEATPYYLFHPHAPARVAGLIPHVKLIVLLRNPVERAYSHYNHEVRKRAETLTFPEAVAAEAERLRGEAERMLTDESYYSFSHQHHSYLARGIYADQLNAWAKFFPPNQMLVLKSEDFYRDPESTLRKALTFLGLREWRLENYRNFNEAANARMDAGLRRKLADFFVKHNRRLYDMLGIDYGWE